MSSNADPSLWMTQSPLFPFSGKLAVKQLSDPMATELPREGEAWATLR
jgi:hypothetical protein